MLLVLSSWGSLNQRASVGLLLSWAQMSLLMVA